MREEIIQIIQNNNRSYANIIRKNTSLRDWVYQYSRIKSDDFKDHIRSAVYNETNICNYGNIRPLKSITRGFGFCGPANRCDCAKEHIASQVKKAKESYTNEQKEQIKQKRAATNLERYGATNPFAVNSVKEKIEKTNLEKYGCNNPQKNPSIREKTKKTNIEKYGSDNVMHNAIVLKKNQENRDYQKAAKKVQQTKFEKYGDPFFRNSNKAKKTNIKRYGCENPANSAEVKQKISDSLRDFYTTHHQQKYNIDFLKSYNPGNANFVKCKNCNTEFNAKILNGMITKCPQCCPPKYSEEETELFDFVKSIVPSEEIIRNNRTILNGKEIDIFIPNRNLGFEYNGLYWHTEESGKTRKYHFDKTSQAHNAGIQLIQIFSDLWTGPKQDIVKSRIQHILGRTCSKIMARECEIKEISTHNARIFLENYHLDGYAPCKVKLGLYKQSELISVMTFGSPRFFRYSTNDWELIRYASIKHTNVVGGASKLFSYFCRTYTPECVITFSDNTWGYTNFYQWLGFVRESHGAPGYFYLNRNHFAGRINRMSLQKHKLIEAGFDEKLTEKEIAFVLGLSRVWDCGHSKWIYKKNI